MLESYIRLTEDRWLGTVNFYKDALPRENKLRNWATGWQQHILTLYDMILSLFHKMLTCFCMLHFTAYNILISVMCAVKVKHTIHIQAVQRLLILHCNLNVVFMIPEET